MNDNLQNLGAPSTLLGAFLVVKCLRMELVGNLGCLVGFFEGLVVISEDLVGKMNSLVVIVKKVKKSYLSFIGISSFFTRQITILTIFPGIAIIFFTS
ncbi:hypothetical protein GCM10011384_28830 [Psychrobacillus lasiicapitis]|nr:hypothetical protein GCM10011384_28830 [Psychrobacillus lasiicapitis]